MRIIHGEEEILVYHETKSKSVNAIFVTRLLFDNYATIDLLNHSFPPNNLNIGETSEMTTCGKLIIFK